MKRTRVATLVGLVGLAMAVGACSNSSSSPTTPTVTLGTPTLVSPAAFATISGTAQPITLTVTNVSGASASATYTFEVASDVATVRVRPNPGGKVPGAKIGRYLRAAFPTWLKVLLTPGVLHLCAKRRPIREKGT